MRKRDDGDEKKKEQLALDTAQALKNPEAILGRGVREARKFRDSGLCRVSRKYRI